MNGHHGRSADVKFAALNAEGNLDSAERSTAKLKSGQINKGGRKIQALQCGRGRGHIFCKQGAHLSKKPKSLEKNGFSWESGLQTEAISRHYKVLVQLSLPTAGRILVHMVLPKSVCVFAFLLAGILTVPWLHSLNTSNNWLVAGGKRPSFTKNQTVPPFLRLFNSQPSNYRRQCAFGYSCSVIKHQKFQPPLLCPLENISRV